MLDSEVPTLGTTIMIIRKVDAQLRYYFHIDPDTLSDDEWIERYEELVWIRKEESKAFKRK